MAEAVRLAAAEDIQAVMALEQGAIAHPWPEEDLRRLVSDDDKFALVIEGEDGIEGYIGVSVVVGDGADTIKAAFERAGAHVNVYYARGAAILPKGIAAAAYAKGETGIISGRDIEASYCAASRVKTLKE